MPRARKAREAAPETWQERELREALEAVGRMLEAMDAAPKARLLELVSRAADLTPEEETELDALIGGRHERKRIATLHAKRGAKWVAKHGKPSEAELDGYFDYLLDGGPKARRRAAEEAERRAAEQRPAIASPRPQRAVTATAAPSAPVTNTEAATPRKRRPRRRAGLVGTIYPNGATPALYDYDEE